MYNVINVLNVASVLLFQRCGHSVRHLRFAVEHENLRIGQGMHGGGKSADIIVFSNVRSFSPWFRETRINRRPGTSMSRY